MDIIPAKDKRKVALPLRLLLWFVATGLGGVLALLVMELLKNERVFRRWDEIAIASIFIGAFSGILTENILQAIYRSLRGL